MLYSSEHILKYIQHSGEHQDSLKAYVWHGTVQDKYSPVVETQLFVHYIDQHGIPWYLSPAGGRTLSDICSSPIHCLLSSQNAEILRHFCPNFTKTKLPYPLF